MQLLLRIHPLM